MKPVPAQLKTTLNNNQKNMVAKKEYIQSLQTRYRNTEAEYDRNYLTFKSDGVNSVYSIAFCRQLNKRTIMQSAQPSSPFF